MTPVPGKKIGTTVAHGDLHVNNMFYDEKQDILPLLIMKQWCDVSKNQKAQKLILCD